MAGVALTLQLSSTVTIAQLSLQGWPCFKLLPMQFSSDIFQIYMRVGLTHAEDCAAALLDVINP